MPTSSGFVYVIGAESSRVVKIGFAVDPSRRLTHLQTGSPVRLAILAALPGSRTFEAKLHKVFKDLRKHGEWFDFGKVEPVTAIAEAWLTITRQPESEIVQFDELPEHDEEVSLLETLPAEIPSAAEELLVAVRDCYLEGEEYLAAATLVERLMAKSGHSWWHHEWRGATPKSSQWGLRRSLAVFEVSPDSRSGYYLRSLCA